MNRNRFWQTALLIVCVQAIGQCSYADTFGSGANSFDIDFVTIGNPGNPPDTTGVPNPAGSVPYVYRMGKYDGHVDESDIDLVFAQYGLHLLVAT